MVLPLLDFARRGGSRIGRPWQRLSETGEAVGTFSSCTYQQYPTSDSADRGEWDVSDFRLGRQG